MNGQISPEAIHRCCADIFPEGVVITDEFIKCLRPEGLKAAFRAKVKETHPDKIKTDIAVDSAELFRKTVEAYETLLPIISNKHNNVNPSQVPASNFNKSEKFELYHEGDIPKIKLRFSQFLYYKGVVSWSQCISSLTWQRCNRPLFGKIAMDKGWLSIVTAGRIISMAKAGEKFGETAERLRVLTSKQVLLILGNQSSYRAAVGTYFVENGIFTEDVLKAYLREFYFHNFKYGNSSARSN
ncbi:MAG: J domain-containing protein [Fibrobacteres bacterium]|nr:J domain-containing protein [Fibrobacterota bacterium]